MSENNIDLKVLMVGTQPSEYQFNSGSICLFITDDKGVEMPMGQRSIPLPAYSVYLFYDQKRSFNLSFIAKEDSPLCIITLSIDTLHHIIAQGTDELNFSQAAIFEKEQYHHFEESSTTVRRCVHQIHENPKNHLLREAKKFAILDDYFNASRMKTVYKCPFLNQKENVTKVRDAKEFLISDLQNSPTIKELAKKVALNEYNLKTGFKEIYGKTIHSYLKDFKMTRAHDLITKREFQIAEIADQLGYSNVSHFIDAFKKKYGVTPKKFEMSLS
ncbi:MAG: helix-turn-helix transcriptional regulator [Bacteroidia bacterium]